MTLITPEPYRVFEYYNQLATLGQCYDIEINGKGIRELPRPTLKLSQQELMTGQKLIQEVKEKTKKDKIVIFQAFGRGTVHENGMIADPSGRSFEAENVVNIVKKLSEDFGIIFMSEIAIEFQKHGVKNPIAIPQNIELRYWAGIMQAADHFLGCDSMGQHIAKAFGKTATVVTGSTYPINITYPNSKDFDIIDVGLDKRKYSPIRISMDDEIDRYNDEAMEMTSDQIKQVVDSIKKRMGKSTAYTGSLVLDQNQQNSCCPPSSGSTMPLINQNSVSTPKLIPSGDKKGFGSGSNSIEKEIKKLLKN